MAHRVRRSVLAIALLTAGATVLVASSGSAQPSPALPSLTTTPTVKPFPVHNVRRTFPVYGPHGHLRGHTSWLVTPAGGNCCEDYVAAQPGGRLLVFGGTYPMYSGDLGHTWREVKPITPLNNGEGAIVAGPGGQIAAIGWDAYSGDHLQAFR